ncbi:MAG: TetR/AcrR family transcriptional regulator [Tyzzerella sp.]|nr:TetR/AcrR family transcriptional regulator [Tyzzerella sp.]
MQSDIKLSRQQQKSKETKERIFQAAKEILQKNGYENLSIKNICEVAGVSNGSFYHHFQSKDDLLSYHLEEQPSIDPGVLEIPADKESAKEAIVEVYLNYASYCDVLGVDFIAGYYHTRNQALNPDIRTERPYPIVTVQQYLEKAVAANAIQLKLSIEEVVTDIRMLVIGNAFEWALRNGKVDMKKNIRRSISHYLDGVLI